MSENEYGQKVLTQAEKAARKAFREVEAKKAMTDHGKERKAFNENYERLKSERLAREGKAKSVELGPKAKGK